MREKIMGRVIQEMRARYVVEAVESRGVARDATGLAIHETGLEWLVVGYFNDVEDAFRQMRKAAIEYGDARVIDREAGSDVGFPIRY